MSDQPKVNLYSLPLFNGSELSPPLVDKVVELYNTATGNNITGLNLQSQYGLNEDFPRLTAGNQTDDDIEHSLKTYVRDIEKAYGTACNNGQDLDATKRLVYLATPLTTTIAIGTKMASNLPETNGTLPCVVAWKAGPSIQLLNLSAPVKDVGFFKMEVEKIWGEPQSFSSISNIVVGDYLFVGSSSRHQITADEVDDNCKVLSKKYGMRFHVDNLIRVNVRDESCRFITNNNIGDVVNVIRRAMDKASLDGRKDARSSGGCVRGLIVHACGPQPLAFAIGALYGTNTHGSLYSVDVVNGSNSVFCLGTVGSTVRAGNDSSSSGEEEPYHIGEGDGSSDDGPYSEEPYYADEDGNKVPYGGIESPIQYIRDEYDADWNGDID